MAVKPRAEATIKLEISRRFEASPERVFDAWLDPAAVGQWLFATPGGVMKRVEIEPRIGGRFRIDKQRGEALATHFGAYLEIDRPRRLVFSFATDPEEAPSIVTVEIAPAEGGCVLTLTHEMDAQWADYADRTRDGWTKILDGLSRTLEEDRTLTLTRLIDAPRALVWKAWTDPAHLPRWWGPRGFSNTVHEIDLRPGGVWRFTMTGPDGTAYRNRVAFQEVVAPERLVYTIDDDGVGECPVFHATVTFEERGGKTLLTMRAVFDSAATRAAMIKFGAAEGAESTLDCLEEHVAAMATDALGFTLIRRLDAPRALVFRMWTEPEHMSRWCRPKDFTVVAGTMDVRPGGEWTSHIRGPDGADYGMRGVYREIVPNERIVFTHAWLNEAGKPGRETVITLTFQDHGAGTKLTFRQATFETAAARDSHAEGWGEALDNLAAYLGNFGRSESARDASV